MGTTNKHFSPPDSPPQYSLSHLAMGPSIPSDWFHPVRSPTHCRDHDDGDPVLVSPPIATPPLPTDRPVEQQASFEIFQKIPPKTIITAILAWTDLALDTSSSSRPERLEVVNVTHRKSLVSEHQHEFLLLEVCNISTGETFHVAVNRDFKEYKTTKTEGFADDTLAVLSNADIPFYTSASTVKTLTWGKWSRPPLYEVIALLCLMSLSFPQYTATHYNCYHYAVVGSLALETYRTGPPTSSAGDIASKGSMFFTAKMLDQEDIDISVITIIVRFYENLLIIKEKEQVTNV